MSTAASQQSVHWQRTKRLMIIHLVIWFIFSFVIHRFAADTNKISIMSFPLGYYMAAQGSLIVFVIQLFFFSKQQDKIDRECGMAEAE
jgi:putative solute:sodium symporter small subunit